MKKTVLLLFTGVLIFLGNCTQEVKSEWYDAAAGDTETPAAEITGDTKPIAMLPVANLSRYSEATHQSVAEVCAWQWGLTAARQANIGQASRMPDTYQSGLENGFNQQWSHAYLYAMWGIQVWGDADDDFHDNLNGNSGESESPEGYNGLWAGYYYNSGNQYMGDWYMGYALHYIEDTGLIVHASAPSVNMLAYHFSIEDWINNNLTTGHNFLSGVGNDWNYYAVTDPKAAIRSCALGCSYLNSSLGKDVWDAYMDSGCPTGAGTGSSALVNYTRQLIIRMARYTKGAIKYALDRYNQWSSAY